ncbi:MAG TPA: hypothetical protein VMU45_07990, partial [Candidatus Eisenbacteria bacterium]|nr:hypothetical protein [Candidatus Eisenbacteria bacterium]
LVFENHHQNQIAAYLVNCLTRRGPNIRVVAQNRNENQSFYQLDYVQDGQRPEPLYLQWWSGLRGWNAWPAAAALFVFAAVILLARQKLIAILRARRNAPAGPCLRDHVRR